MLIKIFFYVSIICAIGLGFVIYFEKTKKPSEMLIDDNKPEKIENSSNRNLKGTNSQNTVPPLK